MTTQAEMAALAVEILEQSAIVEDDNYEPGDVGGAEDYASDVAKLDALQAEYNADAAAGLTSNAPSAPVLHDAAIAHGDTGLVQIAKAAPAASPSAPAVKASPPPAPSGWDAPIPGLGVTYKQAAASAAAAGLLMMLVKRFTP